MSTTTIRFLTGTWYDIVIPTDKVDTEGYSPTEIYNSYFNDEELPDDVEVIEGDVDHIFGEELACCEGCKCE